MGVPGYDSGNSSWAGEPGGPKFVQALASTPQDGVLLAVCGVAVPPTPHH